MATIVVSGFKGFAGHERNPSWEMIKDLPDTLGGADIVTVQIPTEFHRCVEVLVAKAREVSADAIVAFGLSGRSSNFKVETYGWNYAGPTTDNAGTAPNGLLVADPQARVAYDVPIPPATTVGWLSGGPVPGTISTDAGSYVCESLIYGLGHALDGDPDLGEVPWLFVHTPANVEDTAFGSNYQKRPLADMTASAVRIIEGVAADILGITAPVDPGPLESPVQLWPAKNPAPRSYWNSNATFKTLFRYGGGIQGVPAPDALTPRQFGAYTSDFDTEGMSASHIFGFGRIVSVRVAREAHPGEQLLSTYSSGTGSGNGRAIYFDEELFYVEPVVLAQPAAVVKWQSEPHLFFVTGIDSNGNPFEKRFRLAFPAGTTGDGEFIEIPVA